MEDLFFDLMVNNSECWLYKADGTEHHFTLIDDGVYREQGDSNIYCGCIYDFDSMFIDFTDYTDISQFKIMKYTLSFNGKGGYQYERTFKCSEDTFEHIKLLAHVISDFSDTRIHLKKTEQ